MPINGHIKTFSFPKTTYTAGGGNVSISASSGDPSAKNMLSMKKEVRWTSVGSNDATTETITIDFITPVTFDRIFVVTHNLKDFDITYDVVPTNFSNVIGLDGVVVGGIIETTYDKNTSYYEFDSVTTDRITITANTTQVVDQEKFITILVATEELVTLSGYPEINASVDKNDRVATTLSGRQQRQPWYQVIGIALSYRVISLQDEIDTFKALYDRLDPFLIWLCGGKYGSPYFKVEVTGFRLEDLYQMMVTDKYDSDYYKSNYKAGSPQKIQLSEVVR